MFYRLYKAIGGLFAWARTLIMYQFFRLIFSTPYIFLIDIHNGTNELYRGTLDTFYVYWPFIRIINIYRIKLSHIITFVHRSRSFSSRIAEPLIAGIFYYKRLSPGRFVSGNFSLESRPFIDSCISCCRICSLLIHHLAELLK